MADYLNHILEYVIKSWLIELANGMPSVVRTIDTFILLNYFGLVILEILTLTHD